MSTSERRRRKTIVVVNDSEEILALLKDLLEEEGYRTVVTGQAAGAYRLIRQEMPQLVILDILMGDAPRWQVLDLLKLDAATAAIPVLICSAAVGEVREATPRLLEQGCDVLLKPFGIDELTDKVARLTA